MIKITGNKQMYERMTDNMDVDVSAVLDGAIGVDQAGILIWQEIVETASGKLTKAEIPAKII